MNQANASEIWWPHPSAFDDLSIVETETGFILEAPPETECWEWLAYFNETPERQEVFNRAFHKMLLDYCNLLENNGQTENQPDQQENHRVEAQEDSTGVLP